MMKVVPMPRRKKNKEIRILNIDDAMMGKESIVEESIEHVETKRKSLSPFDFVKDIRWDKSGTLLDDEENEKAWNTFMVLRVLSMNDNDVDICNFFNQYQGVIPKKSMYLALLGLIAKDKSFYRYINTTAKSKNSNVEFVSRYYEIPEKQAQKYIEIMGDEWANDIKSLYDSDII